MKLLADDTGVSESLGFVLLAMIIMVAMSTVLLIGYPIYQNSINEGHMQNMEDGFYLFTANANKVALYESPIESSELKFYDGTLWLRNDGYVEITYEHTVNGVDVTDRPYYSSLTVTEYMSNNNRIAYVLGGICKKDGNNPSVMINKPLCYEYTTASGTTLVIPLIEYSNEGGSIGGQGLSRVSISSPSFSKSMGTVYYPNSIRIDDVTSVTINMSSTYNSCFSRYFEDELGFTPISPEPDKYILMKKDYSPKSTLYIIPTKLTINVE